MDGLNCSAMFAQALLDRAVAVMGWRFVALMQCYVTCVALLRHQSYRGEEMGRERMEDDEDGMKGRQE